MEYIVIGIVKSVAQNLHNSEVDVKVKKIKEESDHVHFAIIENVTREVEVDKNPNPIQLSQEPKICPATFSRTFPFHILFDRKLITSLKWFSHGVWLSSYTVAY